MEPEKNQNRCNDGAADFLGNFWVGTMQNNIAPDGSNIDIIKKADYVIDLGPEGGENGGNLLFQGYINGFIKLKNLSLIHI